MKKGSNPCLLIMSMLKEILVQIQFYLRNNKKLILYFLGLVTIELAGAKSSLIISIIALSLITIGLICYYELYYYFQFFILISLGGLFIRKLLDC